MEHELNRELHLYLRTGGKKNRRNQAEKMKYFCKDVQKNNPQIKSLGQIGRRQVSEFWIRHNHLSASTQMAYYYAVRYIWNEILDRLSNPPQPSLKDDF